MRNIKLIKINFKTWLLLGGGRKLWEGNWNGKETSWNIALNF